MMLLNIVEKMNDDAREGTNKNDKSKMLKVVSVNALDKLKKEEDDTAEDSPSTTESNEVEIETEAKQ